MDKYYKYMVATLCKTYNHAPYIEEALNGFAMQQTTFPCVYIVIDDASTDGEPDVLRQWAEKNLALDTEKGGVYEQKTFGDRYVAYLKNNANSLFVIILLSENHHCKKPKKPYFSEWIDNAKYRALCEGDDYWTNPQKLRLQVDFLETHPDYSATVHQSKFIGAKTGLFYENVPETVTMNDILSNARLFHTASVVYRAKGYMELPPIKMPCVSGDKLMFLKLSYIGPIKFFENCMCVYRLHSEGMHSIVKLENLKKDKNIMLYMKSIDPHFPKYRFLSFLYGTFALYPKNVSLIQKAYYLFMSFILSFSYFPNNIRDFSKKLQRYRNFKSNR